MSLDLKHFADKLRRYREQFALTMETLSQSTGIPVPALAAFESATREPTGDEVLILADHFRCDYRFFISNEKLAPLEQTELLFRKFGQEFKHPDRWAVQEFLFLCEGEEFLERSLGRTIRSPFSFQKTGNYFKKQGEQAALVLRKYLGFGPAEVPLDLFREMHRLGLHVFRRKLDNSNVSGLFLRHPVARRCVLVNYSEDVFRQRFTVAHEVGHSILDDDSDDVIVSFEKRDRSNLVEVRANAFAGTFLVPPELLAHHRQIHWTAQTVVEFSKKLCVNPEVLVIALRRERMIDDASANLFQQLKVPMHEKRDPEFPDSLSPSATSRKRELLERGLSTYYATLCFDAFEQGVITASRAAELLLVQREDLRLVAELFGCRLS